MSVETSRRHVVCAADALPPGARTTVSVGGRSIVVFNVDGTLYGVRNVCPHQGAPMCEGTLGGTMLDSRPQEYVFGLEGRVLRCPWHGWQFDLATGRSMFDPDRLRVKTYEVFVEDDHVFLQL